MAQVARGEGWDIVGVLNNDMIGNIEGINGVIENNTFRVFSEPFPITASEQEIRSYRIFGGEVDGPPARSHGTSTGSRTGTSPISTRS